MKSNCGSEFIVSISVFECQLCEVFLRHQNDIEKHVDTIKHLASYKKRLEGIFNEQGYAQQRNVDEQDSSEDRDSFQNVDDDDDDSHGKESCPDVRNADEVTEDTSDSDDKVNDPNERCSTVKESGEGILEGKPIKEIEDTNVENTELDERVSMIDLHTMQTRTCDVSGTYFQGAQDGVYTDIKIKQEEDSDVDDCDDEAGIIQGFLEDSDDDVHNNGEHHDKALMPVYTIDNNSKNQTLPGRREEESFPVLPSDVYCKFYDQRTNPKMCEMIHTGEKLFACEFCGKVFTYKSQLEIHKRIHTGEKPFSCDYCGKSFTVSRKLKRHKRIHKKPYSCDVCKKAFNQIRDVEIHMRIHTGERPFACDICGKAFIRDCHLKYHLRIHTGEKPFSCDCCGKAFIVSSKLERHKLIHTGERPYSCDVCKKSFNQSGNLEIHKRIHTGEKKSSCDYCGKVFVISSSLKRHQRIHSGEKPYSCDVCQKTFNHGGNPEIHKQIHTGEKQC